MRELNRRIAKASLPNTAEPALAPGIATPDPTASAYADGSPHSPVWVQCAACGVTIPTTIEPKGSWLTLRTGLGIFVYKLHASPSDITVFVSDGH